MWSYKRPKAKAILRIRNEGRSIMLPDLKLYYRTMIIKTEWYWQKNRHSNQCNRIQSPKVKPNVYGQIIFYKGAKNTQ